MQLAPYIMSARTVNRGGSMLSLSNLLTLRCNPEATICNDLQKYSSEKVGVKDIPGESSLSALDVPIKDRESPS